MNYEKPVVIENNDSFEGVYAASGDRFSGGSGWTWSGRFGNHDSGSYSVLYIMAKGPSENRGDNMTSTCTITYVGQTPLSSLSLGNDPFGGASISGNTITIRGQFNNPNESRETMINCYFSSGSYDGRKGNCDNDPAMASIGGAFSLSWT